jgi:hypothetical protein
VTYIEAYGRGYVTINVQQFKFPEHLQSLWSAKIMIKLNFLLLYWHRDRSHTPLCACAYGGIKLVSQWQGYWGGSPGQQLSWWPCFPRFSFNVWGGVNSSSLGN